MADLDRLVGGKDVILHMRMQFRCNQGTGSRNKSVDNDRDADGGAAEHQAGDAADLETADLGQHIDRVGRVGPVDLESLFNNGHFALQAFVVDTGAAEGNIGDR